MLINRIIITAPEFWTKNPSYTEKVDVRKRKEELGKASDHLCGQVYACGLIFWEILTWNEYGYPYQGNPPHNAHYKIHCQLGI